MHMPSAAITITITHLLVAGIWYYLGSGMDVAGCGMRRRALSTGHTGHCPKTQKLPKAKKPKPKPKPTLAANTNKEGAGAHDEVAIECLV
jgi:hypothetical protein